MMSSLSAAAPMLQLRTPSALALIVRVMRYRDVAAPHAQEPFSLGPTDHSFEVVAISAIRTSNDCRHRRYKFLFNTYVKSGQRKKPIFCWRLLTLVICAALVNNFVPRHSRKAVNFDA